MIAKHWASLLPDVLYMISTYLNEVIDFIHFSAVCKAWRSAVSLWTHHSFLPWILLHEDETENEALKFYSPFSEKIYSIYVPQASDARLMGPAKNYFLQYKLSDSSLSLLNPFAGKEIRLPPLKGEIRYPLPLSIGTCTEKTEDKIIIWGQNGTDLEAISFGISQPGDANWTLTKISIGNIYGACAYYDGMYFISKPQEELTTVNDVVTGSIVSTIPDFEKKDAVEILEHLVVSGGKLLKVIIYNYRHIEKLSLEVYMLIVEERYRWQHIYDIGDHILFLDNNGAFSFKRSWNYGLRRNHIYFFGHFARVNKKVEKCILWRYDLGNGNIIKLPFPFIKCNTWIIPSLCYL